MKRFLLIGLLSLMLVGKITSTVEKETFVMYKPLPKCTIKSLPIPSFYVPDIYRSFVFEKCRVHKVPYWLFCRLISRESSWKETSRNINKNKTVDLGIAMFNSAYKEVWYGYNNSVPFDFIKDSFVCLEASIQHLRWLFDETGDWKVSIAAYNCGLGRATFSLPWPITTQEHVRVIFKGVHQDNINKWNDFYS